MSEENVSSTLGNHYLNSFIRGVLGSSSFCCEQTLAQQKQPETASQPFPHTLVLKTASDDTGWGEKRLWWDHQREEERKKSHKLEAVLMFSAWQLRITYLKTYIACASKYRSYIYYVYIHRCRELYRIYQQQPHLYSNGDVFSHPESICLQGSCGNPDGLQVNDRLCFRDQAP